MPNRQSNKIKDFFILCEARLWIIKIREKVGYLYVKKLRYWAKIIKVGNRFNFLDDGENWSNLILRVYGSINY